MTVFKPPLTVHKAPKTKGFIEKATDLPREVEQEVVEVLRARVYTYIRSFRNPSFQKVWRWLHCILTAKLFFFSLLAFICVFPHLSETPFLSPLKSILTTEQT